MHHLTPGDAVRMIGIENLYAVHIHDNDGVRDLHQTPFNGVIDWTDFGLALHEIGFAGVVSLETAVSEKIPIPLREYEEMGLSKKARYIAALAADGQACV